MGRWDDPVDDRNAQEPDLSPLQALADQGEWTRLAQRVEPYETVRVPAEHREYVDALLFPRGLVLLDEPGSEWPMVVSLDDLLEDAS